MCRRIITSDGIAGPGSVVPVRTAGGIIQAKWGRLLGNKSLLHMRSDNLQSPAHQGCVRGLVDSTGFMERDSSGKFHKFEGGPIIVGVDHSHRFSVVTVPAAGKVAEVCFRMPAICKNPEAFLPEDSFTQSEVT